MIVNHLSSDCRFERQKKLGRESKEEMTLNNSVNLQRKKYSNEQSKI